MTPTDKNQPTHPPVLFQKFVRGSVREYELAGRRLVDDVVGCLVACFRLVCPAEHVRLFAGFEHPLRVATPGAKCERTDTRAAGLVDIRCFLDERLYLGRRVLAGTDPRLSPVVPLLRTGGWVDRNCLRSVIEQERNGLPLGIDLFPAAAAPIVATGTGLVLLDGHPVRDSLVPTDRRAYRGDAGYRLHPSGDPGPTRFELSHRSRARLRYRCARGPPLPPEVRNKSTTEERYQRDGHQYRPEHRHIIGSSNPVVPPNGGPL